MDKPTLMVRYYNLITDSSYEKIEDIPFEITELLNTHSNASLLKPLIYNDMKSVKISIQKISIKYDINYGSAQNIYDKYRSLRDLV